MAKRVPTIEEVRQKARSCRNCDLWRRATQTVFGAGPSSARMMLVGEQPGNEEDVQGEPFVGPAGQALDRALREAGIHREVVYLTNAVKHFKWEPGPGDKRIHKKPNISEQHACRPWLDAELSIIRPEIVVCMGATAVRALFGKEIAVLRDRGKILEPGFAPLAMVTVHPSSILRTRTDEDRHAARAAFAKDLRKAAQAIK
ncbi:MAG: UdgX family uracil-DNA binding protein [Actinobacteria bacterium]|nr:UdgX family uracil-DNA binding protein [Actinomycetota bacterium]